MERKVYARGAASSFESMIDAASKADVVFVGEQHDHVGGHALEAEILAAIHAKKPKLALALEMFERDVQTVLDEYLAGTISEASFLTASRPWPRYATDYKPMVEYCRTAKLPVVASNAPRRYVSTVGRSGKDSLNSLNKASREFLPKLPYDMLLPEGYDKALNEVFGGHSAGTGPAQSTLNPEAEARTVRMKEAQALWDASMADSILRARKQYRGSLVMHVNGSMHSDQGFGIADRVRRADGKLKIVTITLRPDKDYAAPAAGKYDAQADWVVLTPLDPPAAKPAK